MTKAPGKAASASAQRDREQVFTRLVHEHAHLLYRIAFSVLRHAEDAEDAVQEALLKLYRGESWREMRDEKAFLARSVWRVALDRRNARTELPGDETAELRVPDRRPSPESTLAEADERALMHQWIDGLPAELREPLLLSAVEELNSREIGEVMGLPEGTVRTRLMRARAELRARYESMQQVEQKFVQKERGAFVT